MEVLVAEDFQRGSEELELNALFLCVVHFFCTCRKLSLGTAVYDVDIVSTHALCNACAVHSNVAAAEDCDLLCVIDRRRGVFLICLHQVDTGQVLVCGVDAVETLARNVQEVRQTGAGADKDRLIAVSEQVVDGLGAADNEVQDEFNALCLQRVDFLLYNSLRETELRNAVHQNAACGVQYLEYGDVIAHVAQIARTGQTGRAGTDDSDLVAVGSRNLDRIGGRMCHCVVGSETLQTTDRNRLALDAADTLALALTLLRADTTADCREGTGLLDLVVGFNKLALLDQVDEIRNLDVDRTSFYTRLILAVQAAVCLVNCGLSIVAEGYFLKVLISYVRILLRNRVFCEGHIRHNYLTSILRRLQCSLCALIAACSCGL